MKTPSEEAAEALYKASAIDLDCVPIEENTTYADRDAAATVKVASIIATAYAPLLKAARDALNETITNMQTLANLNDDRLSLSIINHVANECWRHLAELNRVLGEKP